MAIEATEVAKAIVESIVAAGIYDKAMPAGCGYHTKKQEQELGNALTDYLEEQKHQYRDNGAAILTDPPASMRMGNLYNAVLRQSCDEKRLLDTWMEGYRGDFPEETRAVCMGCVQIILSHIKTWPEFVPDMAIQNASTQQAFKPLIEETHSMVSDIRLKMDEYPQAVQPSPPAVANHNKPYLDKWTDPLFLNDPSTFWDAKEVMAQDLYIPLRFRFGGKEKPREDKDNALWAFLSKPGGHLVLGDPGIGKSTLISRYLAEQGKVTPILSYPLTEFGLTGGESHPGTMLLKKIGSSLGSLRDTVLFLDGLDECAITLDMRADFLRKLQADWGRSFSWVVTCRLNYIPEQALERLTIPRFTLCPLDSYQIKPFIEKYELKAKCTIDAPTRATLTDDDRNDVFGIPLILYMIVASGLQISPEDTLVTVYDKLFDTNGHFYRRSYDLHRRNLSEGYIRKIRQMSRDIALWMLLHDNEKLVIPEDTYQEIEQVFGTTEEGEPLLDSFLHQGIVEGRKSELCFVHRTMYEYFVAEGFVHLAVNAKTPEELSRVIGWYWHSKQSGHTMEQYVEEKLRRHKSSLVFSLWQAAGQLLLTKGVQRSWHGISNFIRENGWGVPTCLCPSAGATLEDDRRMENTAFWNLCHLLFWVRNITGYSGLAFRDKNDVKILVRAIRHCSADHFPIYCPFFNLSFASLSCTNLSQAFLAGSNLSNAHLSGADLCATDLTGADLTNVSLIDANLTSAKLSKKQVRIIGYKKLSTCRFGTIKVATSNLNCVEYTRRSFFSHFFPKYPFPNNKS